MYLGVDIGSTTSKAILLDEEGRLAGRAVVNAGTGTSGPEKAVEQALKEAGKTEQQIRTCVATGYGRMLFAGADRQITEISCHAKGVCHEIEGASTIIDIGGQDAKVIRVGAHGKVENFVMNEKCAAGTGRFLEVMSRVLDCPLDQLSDLAAAGKDGVSISSVCTVFAESEVISQLSEGKRREDVALGALHSIAQRVAGMTGRVGQKPIVVMTGGGALNDTLATVLAREIGMEIQRPDDPQGMGALGAALFARELNDKQERG